MLLIAFALWVFAIIVIYLTGFRHLSEKKWLKPLRIPSLIAALLGLIIGLGAIPVNITFFKTAKTEKFSTFATIDGSNYNPLTGKASIFFFKEDAGKTPADYVETTNVVFDQKDNVPKLETPKYRYESGTTLWWLALPMSISENYDSSRPVVAHLPISWKH